MEMRIGFRSILAAALLLAAGPAHATSTCLPPNCFFGEDVPLGGTIPSSFPVSDAAKASFLLMLGDPATEDFSAFSSGNGGPLDLHFRNPAGSGSILETGTLTDPTSNGDGFIATAQTAKEGFPISGTTYWKNTTDENEGLFHVAFDHPVSAFGFYATAYSTLSQIGGTQLVLDLELMGGGTASFVIPHDIVDTTTGKVFFFGVVADPFLSATLRNAGPDDGDVIGFDDFTVAHSVVPEPGSGALLAGGLLALAAARRRSAK
jgi:hypothetical protein